MMSFYLVSPLVSFSNGSLELATAAIGIYLLVVSEQNQNFFLSLFSAHDD